MIASGFQASAPRADIMMLLEVLTFSQWFMIGVAVALWALIAAHVARQMGSAGRSATRWFIITFLFTAIPAVVVSMYHRVRWILQKDTDGLTRARRKELVRCPHCGGLYSPQAQSSPRVCPLCHMPIQGSDVA